MSPFYPTSMQGIAAWSQEMELTLDESLSRLLHFAVLEGITQNSKLQPLICLYGASLLRLFYGNPRLSADLDLMVFCRSGEELKKIYEGWMRAELHTVLQEAVSKQFAAKIDNNFLKKNLKLEVLIMKNQTEFRKMPLTPGSHVAPLLVCSLEEMIATKLRAISRRAIETKPRPHDIFDVAHAFVAHANTIKLDRVSRLCRLKARNGEPLILTPVHFHPLKTYCLENYDTIQLTSDTARISFGLAWDAVINLLKCLH